MPKKIALRALIMAMVICAGHAISAEIRPVDVPAGDLAVGLEMLAKQSGVEFVYEMEQLKGLRTRGVHGEFTPEVAVEKLLEGTELTVTRHESGAVLISGTKTKSPAGVPAAVATPADHTVWMAQNEDATASSAEPQSTADTSRAEKLDEIVVTAQKRLERLQDVPVPVTALSGETLVNNNQLRIQDYYSSIPGVNFTSGFFTDTISIRGITTGDAAGFTNPTVAIVVDDVPYGSSSWTGVSSVPDLDPGELSRIEVLRGPQGTLYGASSIGGLIKYVTTDPSVDAFSGRVQMGLSSVRNGNDAGYNVRAAINVPLNNAWAIQASAYTRRDPGYIDNIQTGADAVNWRQFSGGRLTGLWKPSEDFSLKLSAIYQDDQVHGSFLSDPTVGDLKQNLLRGSGRNNTQFQVYSANMALKLGAVDLVSVTSYSDGKDSRKDDLTDNNLVDGLSSVTQGALGVPGVLLTNSYDTRKFSEELRLSSALGAHFDWLGGLFYTHEDSPHENFFLGVDPANGAVKGNIWHGDFPFQLSEAALFSSLTWKATERFDIQFGGRYSENRQAYSTLLEGPLCCETPLIDPVKHTKDSSFTYLMTPRLRVAPNIMLYARLASGYRPGGPNTSCAFLQGASLPCEYSPDKASNFELGVKGSFLEHLLTVDASVYYIDWNDVQITLEAVPGSGVSYITNVARAKSQGVELSLEARPLKGMKIGTWLAYNDAEFTKDLPAGLVGAAGFSGDRLPLSSRYSANLSFDQDFPLTDRLLGFAGASASYVGERASGFRPDVVTAQPMFPGYTKIDFRAGVKHDLWMVNGFVTNVTDKRGILAVDSVFTGSFVYIQPRTFGFSISREF